MKLSDYVIGFLAEELGIRHVFGIVGGANSHLADSLAKNPKISFICPQHEQGGAIAAEAYARATGNMGAVLLTSGPGGTNAITGLCCAWTDSIPCIFISGQLPLPMTTDGRTIRQLGVQHLNIIDGVKPYTKYAVMVTDPKDIRYHLEKAAFLAKDGRPGPVWIDIPTNFQHVEIDISSLRSFNEGDRIHNLPRPLGDGLVEQVCRMISESKRPIIIAGNGIRISNPENGPAILTALAEKLGFPIILTWSGIDLVDHRHPLFVGSAGAMGQRGSNYAVANSDLIIAIGSRLDTRQVGNRPDLYARGAKKIVVDIDIHELNKGLIKIDLPILATASNFMESILRAITAQQIPNVQDWVKYCQEWKAKYPVVLSEFRESKERVNSYVFMDELCEHLDENDTVVTDMGTSLTCTMQTFKAKGGGQRLFTNIGLATMGYGLPGAIGAWFGSCKRRIIGIFGDGGLQMNIQELQTVIHYDIPLKMFVLNNESYLTLKHTQKMFFDGCYSGSEPSCGYSAPNFSKVARAYGITSYRLNDPSRLREMIQLVLSPEHANESILCEIMMPPDQPLIPLSVLDKSGGYRGMPIERLYPFLSEEEHRSNMIIETV